MAYDQSVAPKEGKSAISGTTRKKIFGGNQNVPEGAFGGAQDYGQNTSNPFSGDVTMELNNQLQNMANLWNGGGGQQPVPQGDGVDNQTARLKMFIDYMNQKQASEQAFQLQRAPNAFNAEREAAEPEKFAREKYQARMASDPWGPGGQFANAPRLSPAATLASQGNNATNQWAQQGQVPGIDPEELKRANAQAVAGRGYRSYF